jgi:hypothetical protein
MQELADFLDARLFCLGSIIFASDDLIDRDELASGTVTHCSPCRVAEWNSGSSTFWARIGSHQYDPLIHGGDQGKMPQIRKEKRMHDAKSHCHS